MYEVEIGGCEKPNNDTVSTELEGTSPVLDLEISICCCMCIEQIPEQISVRNK